MNVIEKEDLEELIPHRGKMFLIDRITSFGTAGWKISSETKITENFMFYDKELGGAPDYSLFEVAAQTVSALTGLYAKENNLPVKMGMILSVSGMKFDIPSVKKGQTVTVQALRETQVGNVYSFVVSFYIEGNPHGEGKITVMEASEL